MQVFKIDEIIENLQSAKNDGFEYVHLNVLNNEEESCDVLNLEYIDSEHSSQEDFIDSVTLPKGYDLGL